MNRSNLILALLLLIQIVLLGIMVISGGGVEKPPPGPLLPEFSAAAVERITLVDDSDAALTLARGGDGWVLPDADGFAVSSSAAEDLLAKIGSLNTSRLVASQPSSFARLGVKDDDFRRRLSLVSAAGSETLYLGGSGGADAVYVRREGDSRVYLGVGLTAWEASPQISAWIDTSYVNVPQGDILSLRVQNANGSFDFQRAGESWVYAGLAEGAEFDAGQMANLLRNAAAIRMVAPLGLGALPAYGLDAPQITVEVRYRQALDIESAAETEGGEDAPEPPAAAEESYRIMIGARQADGDFALKSSDSEYYVLVREAVFDAFAGISAETLVKPPAE